MNIIVAISKVSDGNMFDAKNKTNSQIIENRRKFLKINGIDIKNTSRVSTVYEGDNYQRYHELTDREKGNGMFNGDIVTSDALITKQANHALFLPIADCIGAVFYDSKQKILMLSHLGRHALEQNGGYESAMLLVSKYNCNPKNILVWMTPAPGSKSYPVFAFNNRSLKDIAFEQLNNAGIVGANIFDNPTDTSKSTEYFSHSEFLKGKRPNDGRFAIVAMMK